MYKLKLWPWMLIGVFLAACQSVVEEGTVCKTDGDCSGGQLCFWQNCLSKGSSSSLIYAEVLPPAISREPPYQVERPYDMAKAESWQIALPNVTARQVVIQGIRGGFYQLYPVESLLQAWQQQGHLVADASTDISRSSVSTLLSPGTYHFSIWPKDMVLPAYHSLLTITDELSYIMAYPVERLLTYHGHIQWEKTTVSPVEGAEVTAVDLSGNYCGQTQSDRDGNYHLSCFDGSSLARILTNSGELNPLMPAIDMLVDWSTIAGRQLPNVVVGEDLPLSYQYNGLIIDSNSDPVAGATVTIMEALGQGTFHDSGFSQKNGQVGLTVWGEQLAALVASCDGYDWQATFTILPRDGSSDTFTIVLPKPLDVTGYVLDAIGMEVVPNAEVIFISGETVQSRVLGNAQQYSVMSDANGYYKAQLPHGDYDVLVKPNPLSGQPWGKYFLRVNSSVERYFYLPRPFRFNGKVVKNGVAVPNAQINFYSLDGQLHNEAVQIGQSVSDDNGIFYGVVPAN